MTFFYNLKRWFVRKRVKNKDFSIISNNCWAGKVYQYPGMPYLSPTAGLYFFADDYLKFAKNLKYYLSLDLEFVQWEDSKHFEDLENRKVCPVGKLDDIEIFFLHYPTKEEAEEKWNRRKKRVNFDNLIFKLSDMNNCTDEILAEFDSLPVKKIIISKNKTKKYDSEVYYYSPENEGKEHIEVDTMPFPSNLDLVEILNEKCN